MNIVFADEELDEVGVWVLTSTSVPLFIITVSHASAANQISTNPDERMAIMSMSIFCIYFRVGM